eukprot:284815403_5
MMRFHSLSHERLMQGNVESLHRKSLKHPPPFAKLLTGAAIDVAVRRCWGSGRSIAPQLRKDKTLEALTCRRSFVPEQSRVEGPYTCLLLRAYAQHNLVPAARHICSGLHKLLPRLPSQPYPPLTRGVSRTICHPRGISESKKLSFSLGFERGCDEHHRAGSICHQQGRRTRRISRNYSRRRTLLTSSQAGQHCLVRPVEPVSYESAPLLERHRGNSVQPGSGRLDSHIERWYKVGNSPQYLAALDCRV